MPPMCINYVVTRRRVPPSAAEWLRGTPEPRTPQRSERGLRTGSHDSDAISTVTRTAIVRPFHCVWFLCDTDNCGPRRKSDVIIKYQDFNQTVFFFFLFTFATALIFLIISRFLPGPLLISWPSSAILIFPGLESWLVLLSLPRFLLSSGHFCPPPPSSLCFPYLTLDYYRMWHDCITSYYCA